MNISRIDLNLLVYLDVLLREKSVTRAAQRLSITQPAMSNGLKRLREMLGDPLLVRTSRGMEPTERAQALQPLIRKTLIDLEAALQPADTFQETTSTRLFRIMASDYAASTLLPELLKQIERHAPNVTLDVMTPSDVTFHDVEAGKVDMAINMFEELPQSFHQKSLWVDHYRCLFNRNSAKLHPFNLDAYLAADHVWVSKTGYGVGVGVDRNDLQRLGWVDKHLAEMGLKRRIKVFTRNYHVAMHLALQPNTVVTVPGRAAKLYEGRPTLAICPPPFEIPSMELKMVWSPLLHHDASHVWLRKLVGQAADAVKGVE